MRSFFGFTQFKLGSSNYNVMTMLNKARRTGEGYYGYAGGYGYGN